MIRLKMHPPISISPQKSLIRPLNKLKDVLPDVSYDTFVSSLSHVKDIELRWHRFGIKGIKKPVMLFRLDIPGLSNEIYLMLSKSNKLLGEIEMKVSRNNVFILNLEAMEKHKGIGTNLLQIAVEKAIKTSDKEIFLNTQKLHLIQKSPEGFYGRLGFTETGHEGIFGKEMVLLPMRNQNWLRRIHDRPITSRGLNIVL